MKLKRTKKFTTNCYLTATHTSLLVHSEAPHTAFEVSIYLQPDQPGDSAVFWKKNIQTVDLQLHLSHLLQLSPNPTAFKRTRGTSRAEILYSITLRSFHFLGKPLFLQFFSSALSVQ